jgi:hypothetical protein
MKHSSVLIVLLISATLGNKHPNLKEVICEMIEYHDEFTSSRGSTGWNCYPDRHTSSSFYVIRTIPGDILDAITNGASWVKIKIPDNSSDELIAWHTIPSSTEIEIISMVSRNSRRSGKSLGSKSVIVVRVIANDKASFYTSKQLANKVFGLYGDPVNLASQYAACSHKRLTFHPANHSAATDGVIEVSINVSVVNQLRSVITGEITEAVNKIIGSKDNFDHVMYAIPRGTLDEDGSSWVAIGSYNDPLSVFNDERISSVSIQVHEVGHNMNLKHSGKNGNEYGDTTCMMGSSIDEDNNPSMCFNGAKTVELGWFPECNTYITNTSIITKRYIMSTTQYSDCCNPTDAVTVEIKRKDSTNLFILYNKKVGYNSGVRTSGDDVMIVSGKERALSWQEADLKPGDEYRTKIDVNNVLIKFCSVISGMALVSVGPDNGLNICD